METEAQRQSAARKEVQKMAAMHATERRGVVRDDIVRTDAVPKKESSEVKVTEAARGQAIEFLQNNLPKDASQAVINATTNPEMVERAAEIIVREGTPARYASEVRKLINEAAGQAQSGADKKEAAGWLKKIRSLWN